jgi:hypothetical protein
MKFITPEEYKKIHIIKMVEKVWSFYIINNILSNYIYGL